VPNIRAAFTVDHLPDAFEKDWSIAIEDDGDVFDVLSMTTFRGSQHVIWVEFQFGFDDWFSPAREVQWHRQMRQAKQEIEEVRSRKTDGVLGQVLCAAYQRYEFGFD
jgi:hypothetical protein